jgi:RNA polymerase sigma-70 factor (ECF subfamily)
VPQPGKVPMSANDFKDGLIKEIPNLRAFAASLSGSMQLADDLVQDTLLKAWGNSDKFEPGTSLRAWLFTILRNTYYSLYRKRGREVQDSEGTYAERMATHGNQESHLDLADFRKALAKLPEEQREVLIMVGATGLSYEETAEICGVAIGTIKSRVNRARTKLAELLSIGGIDDLGPDRQTAAAVQRIGSENAGV